MPFRRLEFLALAVLAGSTPSALQAQARNAAADAPPAVVKDLLDCRALTEATARLACYDARTDALVQAQSKGDLVMQDREQIRAERRGLFGFTLPKLRIFGGGNDDADNPDSVRELTATVASASQGRGDAWIFEVEGNGTWEQTDTTYLRKPAPGAKIEIKRGISTNYLAKVNGGPTFRIKRLR